MDIFVLLKLLRYLIYLPIRWVIHFVQWKLFGLSLEKNNVIIFDQILLAILVFALTIFSYTILNFYVCFGLRIKARIMVYRCKFVVNEQADVCDFIGFGAKSHPLIDLLDPHWTLYTVLF